jgi:hypothetical protein
MGCERLHRLRPSSTARTEGSAHAEDAEPDRSPALHGRGSAVPGAAVISGAVAEIAASPDHEPQGRHEV